MRHFFIFFLHNNEQKTFKYSGLSKRSAIEEVLYLYGKSIVIQGVRESARAFKNPSNQPAGYENV